MAERLQKWLAARGIGSRRQIEGWIEAGRITVNGRRAILGVKVAGDELICLDGRPVAAEPSAGPQTLILNKSAGVICTRRDPEGRPTIFDDLPRVKNQRWISVGRLDLQTSGLLLVTTDGELAARLMHPRAGVEREYAVRVEGTLSEPALEQLRTGVVLDDGPVRVLRLEPGGGEGRNRWYQVTLQEGRNRIVRRVMESVGARVSRLIRVRYGPVRLPRDLPRGRHRPVTGALLGSLYNAAGLQRPRLRQDAPAGRTRRR
jgi:23S rRNA pseudouridine2605 synthase